MPNINVGVIGFGTVGAGTVEILFENRDIISNRVGSEILVKRIADLDTQSDRGFPVDPNLMTKDAMDIINDPQIHIVVELMGGEREGQRLYPEGDGKGETRRYGQ